MANQLKISMPVVFFDLLLWGRRIAIRSPAASIHLYMVYVCDGGRGIIIRAAVAVATAECEQRITDAPEGGDNLRADEKATSETRT